MELSNRGNRDTRALRWALGVWVLLVGSQAQGEDWYVEPKAVLQAFYDDNVRLAIKNPIETPGGKLTAEVEAGRRTEVSEIAINARALTAQYLDATDLNETDGGLGFAAAYQMGRSRLGLSASFDYDSTLTSEVSTSGLVQANKRRERLTVQPSWRLRLTPRAQAEADLSYQETQYEDVDLIPLFDYSYAQAGMSLTYALTERAQVLGRVSYGEFDADQVDTRSDSYGFQAGAQYLVSETTTLTTYAGLRHTKAETPTRLGIVETESTGPLFRLELAQDLELGTIRLSADRALVPSSTGTLLDTTSLGVALDYKLDPKWRITLDASGFRNRSPDGDTSGYDRAYVSVAPGIQRRLSESLSLALSYRYRWQQYDDRDGDASANAVYLSLQYKMPREPLGRWSLLTN